MPIVDPDGATAGADRPQLRCSPSTALPVKGGQGNGQGIEAAARVLAFLRNPGALLRGLGLDSLSAT